MADEKKMWTTCFDASTLRQISELSDWLEVSDTQVVEAAVARMHAEEALRQGERTPPGKFVWQEGDLKILRRVDAAEGEEDG